MSNISTRDIVKLLRNMATPQCIIKADELERITSPIHSIAFRNLGLDPSDVASILQCITQESNLHSLSFSNNVLLCDEGALVLSKNLPFTINEIGLVNCEISDLGGAAILGWMKKTSNLRMICIEQNNFSEELKLEFRSFMHKNPQVLVVV